MKNATAIALLILAFPVFVMADPPATQPSPPLPNPMMRPHMGQRARLGVLPRDNPPSTRPVQFTSQDLDDAMSFMQQYSPYRYVAMKEAINTPDLSDKVKKGLEGQVIKKWRNYKLLEEKFPAMAELALDRIGIEDDLYDLSTKIQADPSQTQAISQQIHDDAVKLVGKKIDEQNARIENLNALLVKEKATLAEMNLHRQNQIKIIERTYVGSASDTTEHGDAPHSSDGATADADMLPSPDDNTPAN